MLITLRETRHHSMHYQLSFSKAGDFSFFFNLIFILQPCGWIKWHRLDDISGLRCPVASLSLVPEPHWMEEMLQSLKPESGTVYQPTYDSIRSHCWHLLSCHQNIKLVSFWASYDRIRVFTCGRAIQIFIKFHIIIIIIIIQNNSVDYSTSRSKTAGVTQTKSTNQSIFIVRPFYPQILTFGWFSIVL